MSERPERFEWLPPFIMGACGAVVAEIAVVLLLYTGPGLMRSLTTVITVEAGALGVGLWTAPGPRPDLVEALRRRILFCLLTFLGATLFGAFWSFVGTVGGTALGQGLGLAVLAALPLYACGGVLGTMGELNPSDARRPGVGASACLGGAFGLAASGVLLPRVLTPASLLLVCIVLISSAGLVYSTVLERRLRVRVRARRPSSGGVVRVEDRHLPARDLAVRLLFEGDALRRWVSLSDGPLPTWDLVVFRSLPRAREGPLRVLLVGGGGSPLPRAALEEHRSAVVDVLERSAVIVEIGREHLDTGLPSHGEGRIRLSVGNIDDLTSRLTDGFDLILVDTASFEAVGGLAGLSAAARRTLFARLATGGVLALGPYPPAPGTWSFPDGWTTSRYRRATSLHLLEHDGGVEEIVVAGTASGSLPDHLQDGFVGLREPPA
jgi:hypothetical protein